MGTHLDLLGAPLFRLVVHAIDIVPDKLGLVWRRRESIL